MTLSAHRIAATAAIWVALWMALAFQAQAQSDAELMGDPDGYYEIGFDAYADEDYERAVNIWSRLAAQGHSLAQHSMGYMYKNGLGVRQNHRRALRWYRRAADQGVAGAMYDLALMYEDGHGTSVDNVEAKNLYEQAAGQGDADSHNNLGVMYSDGRGTDVDHRAAYFHFAQAVRIGGTEFADGNLASMTSDLSRAEMAILDRMVRTSEPGDLYPGWPGSEQYAQVETARDDPPEDDIPSLSTSEVRRLQAALTRLGFDPGPVDGLIGRGTRNAVRQFEGDQGRRVTGEINADILASAEAAVASMASPVRDPDPDPTEDAIAQPVVAASQMSIDVPPEIATDQPVLTVSGRVLGASGIVTLDIDGEQVTVSDDGAFEHGIFMIDDERTVIASATDANGNAVRTEITLIRQRQTVDPLDALDLKRLNPTLAQPQANDQAVALIVGSGSYANLPDAQFADRDAKAFSDYAQYALGVPRSRIRLLVNGAAGLVAINEAVEYWLPAMVQQGKTDVYVFFAGHGLADASGEDAYLLPHDGSAKALRTGALKRGHLLDRLSALGARSVTVMLDTCFSGPGRAEELLVAARPVFTETLSAVPQNVTVISAATGGQIAGSLSDHKHGLFSYFLMRGLEGAADTDEDGVLTAGELSDWVSNNVARVAGLLGREAQTPGIEGARDTVIARY